MPPYYTEGLSAPKAVNEIFRTRSATSPKLRARNSAVKYVAPPNSLPPLEKLAGITEQDENRLNPVIRTALQAIILYSMRASEYLQLTDRDLTSGDRVIVHGRKGSGTYFIYLPGVEEQVLHARGLTTPRSLSGLTYRELYAACKTSKLGKVFSGHTNASRTHFGRQNFVRNLTSARSARELGDCLRHRSTETIKHYGAETESNHGKA